MHIPVLLKEVIECLAPQPNENFIDCTCGFAGHSKAILEKNGPNGKVLGIEWDSDVFEKIKQQNIERLVLANDSYRNLKKIIEQQNFGPVAGVLLDLGMSSWDIESSGRGFSFQKDEILDMRYSAELQNNLTAQKIVNEWPEEEIKKILKEYGEEPFAGSIAGGIAKARESENIITTFQLADIIKRNTPAWYSRRKIHPATKTFQTLRIAVNDELASLQKVLPQAIDCLTAGGRLAIISFHSLEDAIVKKFFKEYSKNGILKIIAKKPIRPLWSEITANPRARSARLRAAAKLCPVRQL